MTRCKVRHNTAIAVAVALFAGVAAGCATEVIDSKATTTVAVNDTTALPSLVGSSLDELVDVLRVEVTEL
ncbi:MAG: hypothetical protein ACKO8V_00755, partial [Actinomycetota bacterium]